MLNLKLYHDELNKHLLTLFSLFNLEEYTNIISYYGKDSLYSFYERFHNNGRVSTRHNFYLN